VDYSLISREHRPRLTAGAFNKLGQYANSPGHRAYCCAELAVFFLAVAVTITIARTHFVDLQMDDQAELVWLGGLVKCQGGISQNGHPSQC